MRIWRPGQCQRINGALPKHQGTTMNSLKTLTAALAICTGFAGATFADPSDDVAWIYNSKITDPSRVTEVLALSEELAQIARDADGVLV